MERALQTFSKKINNFDERMVNPTFYVVKWKWLVYGGEQDVFRLYFS